ncbi:ThuA domain-containing protein [Flagellimonas aequoris]|uniref:ThuA domain-containing protein n=1 Tax=Flagellimonas aequoris TaxID=2306997 RepID=A0A418NBD0_9FLAO|nr:ThuA domain-containing protein [Allomuricauda aequoris]RIV72897.1 ThuA domain-containing protein [Allomuricauda aequoris]TXK05404.1 ThuA domain-containing protein [Allomuricauda aequoris]
MKQIVFVLLGLALMTQVSAQDDPSTESKEVKMPELVLVFTKTAGFRHQSIEKGVQTFRELGRKNGFIALQTESGEDFTSQNLKNYKLIVFLNTTMDVLNDAQQKAFESYIKNGGSYLGVHAASDTEYDWPWYGKLVGGYFVSHPEQQKAKIDVLDKTHPSTAHLQDVWMHFDEWYNFKDLNPNVHVLLKLDETSYKGGINGDNHPIAWYHEYDGGRVFYTGLGHTEASYDEPEFRQHLLGAIEWCLKRK